jgi:uncharacterized protein YjiS (DUF1127 family)
MGICWVSLTLTVCFHSRVEPSYQVKTGDYSGPEVSDTQCSWHRHTVQLADTQCSWHRHTVQLAQTHSAVGTDIQCSWHRHTVHLAQTQCTWHRNPPSVPSSAKFLGPSYWTLQCLLGLFLRTASKPETSIVLSETCDLPLHSAL